MRKPTLGDHPYWLYVAAAEAQVSVPLMVAWLKAQGWPGESWDEHKLTSLRRPEPPRLGLQG